MAALVAAAPPAKPKVSFRSPPPASADTAQAPKKIIKKITADTTTKKVTGTGSRLAINYATSTSYGNTMLLPYPRPSQGLGNSMG